MKLLLERYSEDSKQTIGKLYLLNYRDEVLRSWDSLELPWKDNKRRVSCIPKGVYKARKHTSPKFGNCLWLQDVPNRSEILIHVGNYYTQILGCILIGTGLKDINKDGYIDVLYSKRAMSQLMNSLKDVDGLMIEIK